MDRMSCCLSDLREKEVVNTCTGQRLGYVQDVEIDLCAGRLTAILLPGECHGFFQKSADLRIPWDKIERIGRDMILVALAELPCCAMEEKEKKRAFFA